MFYLTAPPNYHITAFSDKDKKQDRESEMKDETAA